MKKLQTKTIQYIARIFSVVGHPLLTISVLVLFLTHRLLPYQQANWISGIIIFGVTIPITVYNLIKMSKGKFANFDVSNQQERKSFYPVAIALMAALTAYFYCTNAPFSLLMSCVCFVGMLIVFSILNFRIKASLHAGINFYIAFILFHYEKAWGYPMLLFAILILISRKILQRHSWLELICGAILGSLTAIVNSYFL